MSEHALRELAHLVALLPVVPLLLMAIAGVVDRDQVLLSAALAMSYVGDSISRSGFEFGYLWVFAQLVLAYAAIIETWSIPRVLSAAAMLVTTFLICGMDPERRPLLWMLGGAGLIFMGRHGPLAFPVFVYFGLGSVAFYVWIARLNRPVVDLAAYHFDLLVYQGCRIAAILLFCILIVRPLYAKDSHAICN